MQPRSCEALKGLEWGVAKGGTASTLTGKGRQSSRHHARTYTHTHTHTHTYTQRNMSGDVHPQCKQEVPFVVLEIISEMESSDCQEPHTVASSSVPKKKNYILQKRGSRGCHDVEAIGDFATKVAWNNYYLNLMCGWTCIVIQCG